MSSLFSIFSSRATYILRIFEFLIDCIDKIQECGRYNYGSLCCAELQSLPSHGKIFPYMSEDWPGRDHFFVTPKGNAKALRHKEPDHDDTLQSWQIATPKVQPALSRESLRSSNGGTRFPLGEFCAFFIAHKEETT